MDRSFVAALQTIDRFVDAQRIIDGTVNDTDGNPAAFVNIRAETHVDRAPGDCCSQGQFAGYASTDALGHYRLRAGLGNFKFGGGGLGDETRGERERGDDEQSTTEEFRIHG